MALAYGSHRYSGGTTDSPIRNGFQISTFVPDEFGVGCLHYVIAIFTMSRQQWPRYGGHSPPSPTSFGEFAIFARSQRGCGPLSVLDVSTPFDARQPTIGSQKGLSFFPATFPKHHPTPKLASHTQSQTVNISSLDLSFDKGIRLHPKYFPQYLSQRWIATQPTSSGD